MAKIAIVSPFPVFPAVGGNRVRTLNMARAMEELGHELHFILLPSRQMGEFDEVAHRRMFGDGGLHILRRGGLEDNWYVLRRAAAKTSRRLSRSGFRLSNVDETYFEGFTRQIRAIDSSHGFDIAMVQYVGFSRALEGFSQRAHRIIDTHDSFAGQIPSSEERRGLLRADTVIAIQDHEAEIFRNLLDPHRGRVVVVSHIIEMHQRVSTERCRGAAFVGSDFEQNAASLKWFVEAVLPLIRSEAPEFQLNIAGSVGRSVPDVEGVVKLGRVPEFRDVFAETPMLVNAITRGTGIKIKLLEAFGAGVPAVSTELGVQGIAPDDLGGVSVVADGEPTAFADAVLAMYRDAEARRRCADLCWRNAARWNAAQVHALAACLDRPMERTGRDAVRMAM